VGSTMVKLPLKGERKSAGVNGNANCWKQLTFQALQSGTKPSIFY
jgi:hypothetical protein